eukprot:11121802-Lingulodinium_polyedra.AAC.1
MRPPAAFGPRIRVPGRRGGRAQHAASTGRPWSDVCGAQPEAAEPPFGPRTVEETSQWPWDYARRLETAASGDRWAQARAKVSRGLRLTSCYSG